jgi:hypothetical protein
MDGIKPVVEGESHFLEGQEDLAPLVGQDHGNQMLENYVRRYWSRLFETKVSISVSSFRAEYG